MEQPTATMAANSELYLQLLREAGGPGGYWLCPNEAEVEGVCPRCGGRALESGAQATMDWEDSGSISLRYANYCGCGASWVEESAVSVRVV